MINNIKVLGHLGDIRLNWIQPILKARAKTTH